MLRPLRNRPRVLLVARDDLLRRRLRGVFLIDYDVDDVATNAEAITLLSFASYDLVLWDRSATQA